MTRDTLMTRATTTAAASAMSTLCAATVTDGSITNAPLSCSAFNNNGLHQPFMITASQLTPLPPPPPPMSSPSMVCPSPSGSPSCQNHKMSLYHTVCNLNNMGVTQLEASHMDTALGVFRCALEHLEECSGISIMNSPISSAALAATSCYRISTSSACSVVSSDSSGRSTRSLDSLGNVLGASTSTSTSTSTLTSTCTSPPGVASALDCATADTNGGHRIGNADANAAAHHDRDVSMAEPNKPQHHQQHQRREYDEGMHVFSQPLRMDASAYFMVEDFSTTYMATLILFNIGQCYLQQQNEDDRAQECFLRALYLVQCNHPPATASAHAATINSTMIMTILHNIGYLQYRNSELEKALRTYNEVYQHLQHLQAASTTANEFDLEMATTLNCVGVLYFHLPKSDTSRAMECYTRSLELRKQYEQKEQQRQRQMQQHHHQQVATTLNNIGRVHYIKGEYESALAKYLEALRIRRTILGKDHLDVAATVYNAGQTFHQQGELEKALKYYQEFMRITVPKLGQHHRDVAIMLKCMAQIYHERRDYDQALSLYEEALRVGRTSLGMHAEVASIYNKMGNLYYEKGDFSSAIQQYQQGLQVERTVLHSLHPNITVTLTNIGQIHKQRGEYTQALQLYKEALDIQTRSLGESHPSIAVTLSNMGLIHYQNKSYTKSLDIYQEALRIRRDAFGEQHLDVASSLNSIGLVLFKLGFHELAMQSFLESLRIRRSILGNAHRDVAIILYNIATIHLERGDEEEAMKCYKETLRVERAALGPNHSDVILTLQYTAQVHQQRGELKDALQCYNEVLRIQKRNILGLDENDNVICKETAAKSLVSNSSNAKNSNNRSNGNDPAPMARTLNSIANVHLQNGNTQSVVDIMSRAARILRSVGRSEDELRLSGFHLYGFAVLHPEGAPCA